MKRSTLRKIIRLLKRLRDKLDGVSVGPGLTKKSDRRSLTIGSVGPPPPPSPPSPPIVRMEVTTAAAEPYPDILLAKFHNGAEAFGSEVPVKWSQPHAVGDEILATRPRGGVTDGGFTYQGVTVFLEELGGGDTVVRVRITGFTGTAAGAYTAALVGAPAADITGGSTITAAALGAAGTACIVVNASEINHADAAHVLAISSDWTGKLIRVNSNGTKVVQIEAGPKPGETFYCQVDQVGGSDGDATTAATYTYDCIAMNGETIGSGKSPAMGRSAGAVVPATVGLCHFTEAGALVLLWVSEPPETVAC